MSEALTEDQILALKPEYHGPTWQRGPLGNYILPELTLGWQIYRWVRKYLMSPDGIGRFDFTNEQLRWLLWWYAIDDRGRFVYRNGVLQRLKGWGKDPVAAILCIVEFVGPCRFSHFDAQGNPVARSNPSAWVQVAAVNRDQTRNTMSLMPTLMSDRLIADYGIKMGAERIRACKGRVILESVTQSYRALEGGRSTFVLLNETHHWVTGNNGVKMFEVIQGNVTKMARSRYLAITNAYLPSEDSVAQKMREAWERGESPGRLYDSVEAPPETPLTEAALLHMIPLIRGDAVWLDVESIIAAIKDTSVTEARHRRMWLNQIVSDKDSLYTPADWKRGELEASLRPGDEVVLGFDGARYDDDTALVAIRIKDRATFLLDHWAKPAVWDTEKRGRWETPAQAVDSAVRTAFRLYKVRAFFADVNLWESYIIEWTKDYGQQLAVRARDGQAIAWDMRASVKETTRAHERFMGALKDGSLLHDGDRTLRTHLLNTRISENTYGTYFRKESADTSRKVDCYAAWMLAHEALHRFLTNPRAERPRSKTGAFL